MYLEMWKQSCLHILVALILILKMMGILKDLEQNQISMVLQVHMSINQLEMLIQIMG